jgi:exopolysaccharide biosynthesis polyprenyl glycosylphosphotransferase
MNETQARVNSVVNQRAMLSNASIVYLAAKRAFDIVASLVCILLLLPIWIFIMVSIKLDSPGPIFFVQERNGYKGRLFRMYKFRSMIADAEQSLAFLTDRNEASGHMFKMRKDPRVTRIGRFIRRTSIDEFPQLLNVLKGDMSIVGPRPPLPREVVKYEAWHNLRLSVKPGITGLWQISGRNELGFEDMCRLDLKYIRERGFIYDLKIILKTIPVVFKYRGAS